MSVYEVPAAPGANLSSPTVSIVDTDWVREEQVRTVVADDTYDGNMDYSKTFEIVCGPSTVPAGTYEVAIWRRYSGGNSVNHVQMRINGKPVAQAYAGFGATVGVAQYCTVTQKNRALLTATIGGGPYYVKLAEGDVLSFDIGNWDEGSSVGVLEVQKVRFTEVTPDPPLPSWRKALSGAETWSDAAFRTMSPTRSLGNVIYTFEDAFPFGSDACLGIWTWELNGSDITPLSGDTPIGFGGAMTDLSDAADRSGVTGSTEIQARDFCVLPNGDVLAAWIEIRGPILSRLYRIVVKHYDASGDSWSTLTSDLWGHGEEIRQAPYISVDCNEDGDAFIAWSEATTTGISGSRDFVWRCVRWNGGSSFTELGTGQSGFSTASGNTTAGAFDRHLRLRVSPAGVPWVCWPELDPANPNDNEYPFAWYWDGSAWVDSQVPFPTLDVPPDGYIGTSTYSNALSASNYISFAVYGLFYMDLVFCTHEGPSENPMICFQWVWRDQVALPRFDVSGWALFDYGGSPGSWTNERFILEGVDYGDGSVPDQTFRSVEQGGGFELAGGWTQGWKLDHDGQRPWLLTQKGFGSAANDHPYAARLSADGSTWELRCHGWPDDETFPYDFDAGWSDPTTDGGVIVNGTPVVIYRDTDTYSFGLVLLASLPCGGIAAMIWSGEAEALDVERIHS